MNIVERSKDMLLEVGAAPILYLMIALSVVSLAIVLERAWFFLVSAEDLGRLAQALDEQLATGNLAGARALTEGSRSIEGGFGQLRPPCPDAAEALVEDRRGPPGLDDTGPRQPEQEVTLATADLILNSGGQFVERVAQLAAGGAELVAGDVEQRA